MWREKHPAVQVGVGERIWLGVEGLDTGGSDSKLYTGSDGVGAGWRPLGAAVWGEGGSPSLGSEGVNRGFEASGLSRLLLLCDALLL